MLLPGMDLYCARPLALWRSLQHFLPNIGEDQTKSKHLSAEPQGLDRTIVNPALAIALRP